VCLIDFRDISNNLMIYLVTELEFRKFELAFNARTRYVFGLRCFDHISGVLRNILGYTLFEYLSLVGTLSYLSSLLVFGRSSTQRFITVLRPAPSTSLRGDSTGI
jgi:hypothetical protein